MEPPDTPELDKRSALKTERHAILDFLEYLESQQMTVCGLLGECFVPISDVRIAILDRFLGLDSAKMAEEMEALLDYQRSLNQPKGN